MKLANVRPAIYARYSSENQREASIEDQVRRCSDFIRANGGVVDPNLIFCDRAVSGASLNRRDFESLMEKVERGEIPAIVTEDVSRISRDFADGAAIFKQLQYARVPLLGVADGVDTSAPDAKLMFTMRSLFADLYLDQLRDKTHRGLIGRALAKMVTGGLPIGFCSTPVADSAGRTIGHLPKIHPEHAEVVRWIFAQYRAGWSLGLIAHDLNRRGVEPPRAKSKHRLKGWVDGTVRVILHNTKYVGIWEFNKTKWEKVPGTNKRRPKKRPPEDIIRTEIPELRIIEPDVWDEVQARLRAVRARYTKGRGGGSSGGSAASNGGTQMTGIAAGPTSRYPLSSLLMCGVCGNPMAIFGGSSAAYYRCSHHVKRGTCPNEKSVREDVTRKRITGEIRNLLTRPEGIALARKEIAEQLGGFARGMNVAVKDHCARLARTEQKIRGLVEYIADGDRSEYIVSTLKDLEVLAKADKSAIEALEREAKTPIRLPTPDEILQEVFDIETALREDPVAGRELLRRLLKNGIIVLMPGEDGVYTAKSEILPLLCNDEKTGSGSKPKPAYYKQDSGGGI